MTGKNKFLEVPT